MAEEVDSALVAIIDEACAARKGRDMDERRKPARGKPVAAFVVSLIAGLWMFGMGKTRDAP